MVAFPFSFFLGPAAASLNSCRGDYSTSPTPREIPPRVKLKWRPSAVFISTLGRWWVYRVSLRFMGPVGGWVPSVALVLPYKERLGRVQREPQYSKSNISHIHAGPNHSPSTAAVGCFMPPVIRSSRHWHHQLMLLFIFIHYGGWARCEIWNIVTSLKNAPKACFFLYWYSCHCHIISFIVYCFIIELNLQGFQGFTSSLHIVQKQQMVPPFISSISSFAQWITTLGKRVTTLRLPSTCRETVCFGVCAAQN